MGRRQNSYFTEEGIHTSDKHMKIYSVLLVTREMQINTKYLLHTNNHC